MSCLECLGGEPSEKAAVAKAEKIFKLADKDKSGKLSHKEFITAFNLENGYFTRRLISLFDVDNSGTLSFKEFVVGTASLALSDVRDKASFAFRLFDADNSRYLDRKELMDALDQSFRDTRKALSSNHNSKKENIEQVMKYINKTFGDSVSKDDFFHLIQKCPNVFTPAFDLWIRMDGYVKACAVVARSKGWLKHGENKLLGKAARTPVQRVKAGLRAPAGLLDDVDLSRDSGDRARDRDRDWGGLGTRSGGKHSFRGRGDAKCKGEDDYWDGSRSLKGSRSGDAGALRRRHEYNDDWEYDDPALANLLASQHAASYRGSDLDRQGGWMDGPQGHEPWGGPHSAGARSGFGGMMRRISVTAQNMFGGGGHGGGMMGGDLGNNVAPFGFEHDGGPRGGWAPSRNSAGIGSGSFERADPYETQYGGGGGGHTGIRNTMRRASVKMGEMLINLGGGYNGHGMSSGMHPSSGGMPESHSRSAWNSPMQSPRDARDASGLGGHRGGGGPQGDLMQGVKAVGRRMSALFGGPGAQPTATPIARGLARDDNGNRNGRASASASRSSGSRRSSRVGGGGALGSQRREQDGGRRDQEGPMSPRSRTRRKSVAPQRASDKVRTRESLLGDVGSPRDSKRRGVEGQGALSPRAPSSKSFKMEKENRPKSNRKRGV